MKIVCFVLIGIVMMLVFIKLFYHIKAQTKYKNAFVTEAECLSVKKINKYAKYRIFYEGEYRFKDRQGILVKRKIPSLTDDAGKTIKLYLGDTQNDYCTEYTFKKRIKSIIIQSLAFVALIALTIAVAYMM